MRKVSINDDLTYSWREAVLDVKSSILSSLLHEGCALQPYHWLPCPKKTPLGFASDEADLSVSFSLLSCNISEDILGGELLSSIAAAFLNKYVCNVLSSTV
mmetsp:Transcript_10352/g.17530  ORF Transcript_10352/g.17530 Transcript_10352/m.17530 type:complete len:101 (+) Transcript_10352:451-753(+)